jgi:hypothetical protein
MFQVGMSRPLGVVVLFLVTMCGCAVQQQPQVPMDAPAHAQTCIHTQLQKWLDLQHVVSTMSTAKLEQQLISLGEPRGRWQLFYFGLLNQQLDAFASWTKARDTFRQLATDAGLDKEQRDLAAIFLRYNQTRINWYLQHSQLLKDHESLNAKLIVSQEENKLLEQKIKAITDLETSISTRREE